MLKNFIIGAAAFATITTSAYAFEFVQPAWAPEPLPLVPGQVYRTGSPLSKPGLFGLLGAAAESLVGGDRFSGGGAVTWTGSEFANVGTSPEGNVAQPSNCDRCVTINGEQVRTLTQEEAEALQHNVDWSTVENKPRATVPGSDNDEDCGYTFAKAAELYDAGVTGAYDWCAGKPLEEGEGNVCPTGQQLWVTYIADKEIGARAVYSCR